ncbi:hypothetical protein [Sphingomonas sp. PB4P5]|uniref:hypothetical protein n=1 Tax=Parasphingomonas puruogangriensis TaxID=3096155 RepID=UPI002FCAB807
MIGGILVRVVAASRICLCICSTVFSAMPAFAEEDAGILAPVPSDRFTLSPGAVDMRTGQYRYSVTDLSVGDPDSGRGISLTRLTDSTQFRERMAQFSHSWEIVLTQYTVPFKGVSGQAAPPPSSQITVTAGSRSMTFRSGSPESNYGSVGVPVNPSYANLERIKSGATYYYRYTSADGDIINFSTFTSARCGHLTNLCAYATDMTLASGVKYVFTYDNTGDWNTRLRKVAVSTGFALLFEYTTGRDGRPLVSKACALNLSVYEAPANHNCPAGAPSTSYFYSGNFMTQATDVLGAAWAFSTNYVDTATPYTLSFYKPSSPTPFLVNNYVGVQGDPYFRAVLSQQFTSGPTYSYSYVRFSQGDTAPGSEEIAGGSYSYDGKSVSVLFGFHRPPKALNDRTFYITPKPEKIVDELGRTHTSDFCVPFDSLGGCRVTEMQYSVDPEGIRTNYSYDSRLNVTQIMTIAKAGSSLPTLITSAAYSCTVNSKSCRKPLTVTDANGNVKTFTYSADHGGVLTRTLPAVGGLAAVTRYGYAQKFAWVKSGSGYVQAANPVWLLTEERSCGSTTTVNNTCAGGASDELAVTYEYQTGNASTPSNLLLKGKIVTANGVPLRTCYGYDSAANKIWETAPLAGLTSCN